MAHIYKVTYDIDLEGVRRISDCLENSILGGFIEESGNTTFVWARDIKHATNRFWMSGFRHYYRFHSFRKYIKITNVEIVLETKRYEYI